jgi:hypothetical protein
MSIEHYTVPVPASAFICLDWPSLTEEVRIKWGHCTLDKKYGGYVIEDEGSIVLLCTEDLCAVLEEKDRQAQIVTFHDPASSEVSLTNYTVDLPASAKICSDWPSLEAAILQRPGSRVVRKYGGYVIEEDDVVVFACDEKISEEADHPGGLIDMLYEDIAEQAQSRAKSKQEDVAVSKHWFGPRGELVRMVTV